MLKQLIKNHVLATITFWLVIVVGFYNYSIMPREKNPAINFNWIQVITIWRGASASDIESLVTDPIEEAIAKISDVRFVSSESHEGTSRVLVRFSEIDYSTFVRRLTDLRREVQNKSDDELPDDAESPIVVETTSSNAFPTVTIALVGEADDENLRKQSRAIANRLERNQGIDKVLRMGLNRPELQIRFNPVSLEGLGINPLDLSRSVQSHFQDVSAGNLRIANQEWVIRVRGSRGSAESLARLPVITAFGEVPLGSVAKVVRGREKPNEIARYHGKPAVLLAINKRGNANTLKLVDSIKVFIEKQNESTNITGIKMVLLDDQTSSTRSSISTMQNNALVGLLLVLGVTWMFLGFRIAFLTTIGIPFTLAGTFWLLASMDQTLNNSVLLGVVIALGMLVDDAIVVVESIHFNLMKGMSALKASMAALDEVGTPITAAVLTTIAAFMPLMLMPGVLGQFMKVVPLVVTLALIISLVEAFWMLPSHIIAFYAPEAPSPFKEMRRKMIHKIQIKFVQLLIPVLRYPKIAFSFLGGLFVLAIVIVLLGLIKINFFAFDPYRLYYINLAMPVGTPVDETIKELVKIEKIILKKAKEGEIRQSVSYAGHMFTAEEASSGGRYGQVMVSLNPHTFGMRSVDDIIKDVRHVVQEIKGSGSISVLKLSDGPPTLKAVNIKIRGEDYDKIRAAAKALKSVLQSIPELSDITDQDSEGRKQLELKLDVDAARRAGLDPSIVARNVRLFVDGEVVARVGDGGEKVNVRVLSDIDRINDIPTFMRSSIALKDGGVIPLGQLLSLETKQGQGVLRHQEFRRALAVQADLDKEQMDTVQVNKLIKSLWREEHAKNHPDVELDFSGELYDIQESMDAIFSLFMIGGGLIFLILGTQFKSFWQPLMVLCTVPLAVTGVILGLFINQNVLSLFTMYGIVALAGIAVNSAIVLISLANDKRRAGMSLLHAAVYAARRRVVPILITTITTIAGLSSLALGIGGASLMWTPVASAIIWGLGFSTVLTLFAIPLLYTTFMDSKGQATQLDMHADGNWFVSIRNLFNRQFKDDDEAKKEIPKAPIIRVKNESIEKKQIISEEINADVDPGISLSKEGVVMLRDGQIVEAIRYFEKSVSTYSDSKVLNLYAAHAIMLYMQDHGYDDGFAERVQRYLDRVGKLDPSDRHYRQLLQQFQSLKSNDDDDDE